MYARPSVGIAGDDILVIELNAELIVITTGDLPDEHEQREHRTAVHAWNDYSGRILELEIDGFTRVREQATP